MKRKALGRGLSALLPETPVRNAEERGIKEIPVESIRVNHLQPRSFFSENDLNELAESIRRQGILQPLLVRRVSEDVDHYQLIAGERRLRASKRVPLKTVPCIVLQAEETQMLEIALIENIQRADLNPVEEARAYQMLADQHMLTQEQIAQRVGKSREAIANSMRLLNLPEKTLDSLQEGKISTGHAKCLLSAKDPDAIDALTQQIIDKKLSVRDTEKALRESRKQEPNAPAVEQQTPETDSHVDELQHRMELEWQTKVRIKMRGKNKGTIEIHFYDLDQLDYLLKRWKIESL